MGFCRTDRISRVFVISIPGVFKVPHNELQTKPASWSRTGEYWPSLASSGQYFLVRPPRLASKRLKKGMVVLVAVAVLVE